MKRINFKRVLSLVACFAMLLGTLVSPATVAKAEGAAEGGGLHWANCYDWRPAGDGHAYSVFAFASADETASANTLTGQAAGFFAWWYGFVLEYNAEKGTYVVTAADMVASDGVCAVEATTLGEGKIVVLFHDGVAANQADSFNYFLENVAVGAEFSLTGDYNTLVATAGALTDTYLTLAAPGEQEPQNPEEPQEPEVPQVTSGGLHWANGYDWGANGHANSIFVFASADTTANISSIVGQAAGTFGWWYGLVLEYDAAKDVYVVTLSDLLMDGVNEAETATLGEGKLAIMFHGDAASVQPDSFTFFTTQATLGSEFKLEGDYNTLLATAGAISGVSLVATGEGSTETPDVPAEPTPEPTPEPLPESTIGYLTKSNAYNWLDDHLKQILVLTSDDPELEASAILGQSSANNVFGWWYGLTLEYNEEKGVFVVTAADLNPDGVCEMEAEKMGYGKMVIIFYPDVKEKQPESVAYFLTHAEIGTEHYLVGNYDDMIWVYDKLADTYLTSEKPETYWTKSDATPTPEPTATTAPTEAPAEPTQAPTPVVQEDPGMNPIVIAVIAVAVVAVVGVVIVVIKKRK